METFWMVWGERKKVPAKKHESWESAAEEAERLAAENLGFTFHVLRSSAQVKAGLTFIRERAL